MVDSVSHADGAGDERLLWIQNQFPRASIVPLRHQGCCSTTYLLTNPARPCEEAANDCESTSILQFRAYNFKLDPAIADAARKVHGHLAPQVHDVHLDLLGEEILQVTHMSLLPGIRFSEVKPEERHLDQALRSMLCNLMTGMAEYYAQAWTHRRVPSALTGKIGRSLRQRLDRLGKELPTAALRRLAQSYQRAVEQGGLGRLPVVLTHGDLLPTNIMVDERSWRLTGIIDWAEGEYLPFGLSLYAIDHLLGVLSYDAAGKPIFKDYIMAYHIRSAFYVELRHRVPRFESLRGEMNLARQIGVMLWHGFAWENGKIDRVVNERDDAVELAYLRGMLKVYEDAHL